MTRHRALRGLLAPASALGLLAAAPSSPPAHSVVTVFAAASLREAFESAAPAFTRQTGFAVRFSFGGSDALATQVLQGAPADVFASANGAQMARAAALTETPRTFARNRLVVIVPGAGRAVASIADLAKPGVRVVLAPDSVPVGAYARLAFGHMANDPAYGAAFAERVRANVVSEELDVKAIAAKIVLGEGDAGVVYATDVAPIAARVRVVHFPPGVAPAASYPIAVLRDARNAAGARAFVDFITSPAGRAALKARGFET